MEKYLKKLKEINTDKSKAAAQNIELLDSKTQPNEFREAVEVAIDLIEADLTSNDIRELLRQALKTKYNQEFGPYILDFSDSFVIFELESDQSWKSDYSISNNKVVFGDAIKVLPKTIYEPIMESKKDKNGQFDMFEKQKKESITGDYVQLIEASIGDDGTIPIKIIQPGWGSSGYYSEEVLERDASVYKEGTKMYWDHPTASDEFERPERSLNDLAGVLVSEGVYNENGSEGAGIYAKAKVFGDYQTKLSEMAPHIGLSHIAGGMASYGEMEGKSGKIVESLKTAESVDFVTSPGAGGQVISLFESARNKSIKPIKMAENTEELTKLKESITAKDDEIKRLKEKEVLSEAKEFVADKLKESELPDEAKVRLSERLNANVIKDDKGGLDLIKFGESVKKEIEGETSYLASLTESGKIKGMGSSHEEEEKTSEKFKESNKKSFEILGFTGTQLDNAVKGRN